LQSRHITKRGILAHEQQLGVLLVLLVAQAKYVQSGLLERSILQFRRIVFYFKEISDNVLWESENEFTWPIQCISLSALRRRPRTLCTSWRPQATW
jgi:hypothetical protein